MVGTSRIASHLEDPVVVCVDDDPNVLSAIARLLRREPYDLLTTDKPRTALKWIQDRKVAVLITDLKMPGMDGLDLLKIVEERSPDTSSIVLTGFPEKLAKQSGRSAHPPRMIAKPWSDSQLKDAIRELVPMDPAPAAMSKIEVKPPSPKAQVLLLGAAPSFRSFAYDTLIFEGFDLHMAETSDEGLRLLRSEEPSIEMVLLCGDAAGQGAGKLAGLMRMMIPGLHVVVVADKPGREEMASFYQAGVVTALPRTITAERLADFMKRSIVTARASLERHRKAHEIEERHAKEPRPRRILRLLKSPARAPSQSRLGQLRKLLSTVILSGLVGVGFAAWWSGSATEPLSADGRHEALENLGERLWRASLQEQTQRRWYWDQQLGLGRDANEQMRRFHEDELKERRWESMRPVRRYYDLPR